MCQRRPLHPPTPTSPTARPAVEVRDNLQAVFADAGVVGSFALLDVATGQRVLVDAERARRRAVPASTFKIPHSIVALETGVAANADQALPYGGRPQPRWWRRR